MSHRMHGGITGGSAFVTGILVGAGAGLLLAPASGLRARHRIKVLVEDLGGKISGLAADARSLVERMIARSTRRAA